MRKVTYPTRVVLSEIPDEGRSFFFDNEGAELTPQLQDLLAKHPYKIQINLKPIGNVYEITGKITAERTFPCSRCGADVSSPADFNFSELILVEKSRPRKSSTSHVSHSEEGDGPFCNYVYSENFDLGEFTHEQLATNEPYQVLCGQPDCDDYVNLLKDKDLPEDEVLLKNNPFAVLKNLKPQ